MSLIWYAGKNGPRDIGERPAPVHDGERDERAVAHRAPGYLAERRLRLLLRQRAVGLREVEKDPRQAEERPEEEEYREREQAHAVYVVDESAFGDGEYARYYHPEHHGLAEELAALLLRDKLPHPAAAGGVGELARGHHQGEDAHEYPELYGPQRLRGNRGERRQEMPRALGAHKRYRRDERPAQRRDDAKPEGELLAAYALLDEVRPRELEDDEEHRKRHDKAEHHVVGPELQREARKKHAARARRENRAKRRLAIAVFDRPVHLARTGH